MTEQIQHETTITLKKVKDYFTEKTWGLPFNQIPEEKYTEELRLTEYELLMVQGHRLGWVYRMAKEEIRLRELIKQHQEETK